MSTVESESSQKDPTYNHVGKILFFQNVYGTRSRQPVSRSSTPERPVDADGGLDHARRQLCPENSGQSNLEPRAPVALSIALPTLTPITSPPKLVKRPRNVKPSIESARKNRKGKKIKSVEIS